MITIASQITSLTVVYPTVYSDADQRKHQSSASLAFVWGIHRDRWIPRTNGQLRGKCFHLMTSSCCKRIILIWHDIGSYDDISSADSTPGARLTKAYDVTIQRYRTHTQKMKIVKGTFCGVWVQNFEWNFKGALWNFTQNFEPIHHKICILRGVRNVTTYDILELWHLKS